MKRRTAVRLRYPFLPLALALLCACAPHAIPARSGQSIIVRWASAQPPRTEQLREIEALLGVPVQHEREMSGAAHVLRILRPVDERELDAALQRLTRLPHVRYAVRNQRRVAH